MKNQKLRKEILKAYNSKVPNMMPNTASMAITSFSEVNIQVYRIFEERFESLWEQIEGYYGKFIEDVLPGKYDKTVHKKVFKEVMNEQVKYVLYGKIYEMAKNDLDDPLLENLISYNESTGFFELKELEAVLDYIIHGLFFPVFMLIDLSEGKVEELNKKIMEHQNRFGTYPKELFIEAYRIQEANKGQRPKITDEDSIVMANKTLKADKKLNLIDENGQKTILLLNITKSYSNYHKQLLKKGGGQY